MEGRLLRLERPWQYDKESPKPWHITNNPERLGVALSDSQIPPNPTYLFTTEIQDPGRVKREHLIDYLSDLLAEERFQAEDGEGGAWTEWRLHAIGGIDDDQRPINEKAKVIIVRYQKALPGGRRERTVKGKGKEAEHLSNEAPEATDTPSELHKMD